MKLKLMSLRNLLLLRSANNFNLKLPVRDVLVLNMPDERIFSNPAYFKFQKVFLFSCSFLIVLQVLFFLQEQNPARLQAF